MSAAKLLADAKNAAGDMAVAHAEAGDHRRAREWVRIAIATDALMRQAVRVAAGLKP